MEPEELFESARARARRLDVPRTPDEAALDALRAECASWCESVPEPPLYPRLNDPARKRASELIPRGEELLAKCLSLARHERARQVTAPLVAVLEAHLSTLCHIAEGRFDRSEREWHRAMELEKGLSRQNRLWVRNDEDPRPVFDQSTRASRFDPGPEPSMTMKLVCPRKSCATQERYRCSPRYSTHRFVCIRCKRPFIGYFGEVRSWEVTRLPGSTRYLFRVMELSGALAQVQVEDRTGAQFPVGRRDLMAFLYDDHKELQGLLNLSNGKLLWIRPGGPCFIATAAFGPEAPELDGFRRFRDRVLMPSVAGRALVRSYYRLGPTAAGWVVRSPALRKWTRVVLKRLHAHLERGRDRT
jgi:hypothetical protein